MIYNMYNIVSLIVWIVIYITCQSAPDVCSMRMSGTGRVYVDISTMYIMFFIQAMYICIQHAFYKLSMISRYYVGFILGLSYITRMYTYMYGMCIWSHLFLYMYDMYALLKASYAYIYTFSKNSHMCIYTFFEYTLYIAQYVGFSLLSICYVSSVCCSGSTCRCVYVY
jgi:hypothetical protein